MILNSETHIKIPSPMNNMSNSQGILRQNVQKNSFINSSTSNISELSQQQQNLKSNSHQYHNSYVEKSKKNVNYSATDSNCIQNQQQQIISIDDSFEDHISDSQSQKETNNFNKQQSSYINNIKITRKQSEICISEDELSLNPSRNLNLPNNNNNNNKHKTIVGTHLIEDNTAIIVDRERNCSQLIHLDDQFQQSLQAKNDNNCITIYEDDSCFSKEKKEEYNDSDEESSVWISNNGLAKIKKIKIVKADKLKGREYQIMPTKRYQSSKMQRKINAFQKQYSETLKMMSSINPNFQFFLFCDILIEYQIIVGKEMKQCKRADSNNFKAIAAVIEYTNSNLIEINTVKTVETQMEFKSVQKYLLSLQNQYAKQCSDSLEILQEKTRMAQETILMIQRNQMTYEYMLKRKEYAEMKYLEFKQKTLPNNKYYIYNHYVFDTKNGNISVKNTGISKAFVDILAINPEYFKQMMQKYGLIEFLKRDFKTAFSISYFTQFAYNMRNFPKVLLFASEFITLDNIEIKVNIEHQVINLCKEFDDLNNFDCPFIDFVGFLIPQISDNIEESLAQIRQEQQIDINSLIEMDDEEIDFYYNSQSQQFLKRYYSDIYNKDLKVHNLVCQKVDFSKQGGIQKSNDFSSKDDHSSRHDDNDLSLNDNLSQNDEFSQKDG